MPTNGNPEIGTAMNVIQINGLTKAYGGTRAVDGLNMRVGQGDIYGFV